MKVGEMKLWADEKPDEDVPNYVLIYYPVDPEPYMLNREEWPPPDDCHWCYAPLHPER